MHTTVSTVVCCSESLANSRSAANAFELNKLRVNVVIDGHMSNSEYAIVRAFQAASKAYLKNIVLVVVTALILPLPSFVLWMEAPLHILSVELTLLDAFYLSIAIILTYGMFGSANEKITMRSVFSVVLKPAPVLTRSWQFFFSESPGFWKSIQVMVLGIIFGLGAQWIAGPWKIPADQNAIGACIYAVVLIMFSKDLTGWMLAPFYLANRDLEPADAYKRSLLLEKEHRHWSLRLTAVLSILFPVLLFGFTRYLLLKPADFENFQLNLPLTYFLSIVPWMATVFVLFLWNEIYKQRITQPPETTAQAVEA